jgi:hypothetical protein
MFMLPTPQSVLLLLTLLLLLLLLLLRCLTSRLQKAISGSIIQNSARCLLVWLFSALKVGPKV